MGLKKGQLLGVFCCLLSISAKAQNDTIVPNRHNVVALKLHYGTIVIHTPSVRNLAGSRPFGGELEFSKVDIDSAAFNKCNCFPRYGVALSYFDLDNPIIGHGIMMSYFIEPSYRLSNFLQFNLRAAAGLVYASNPFDSIRNIQNKSYTTHINPYLQVGIGITSIINRHFSVALMSGFQHFSNGGFKEPNRGVNWLTGSVGFLYSIENNVLPKYVRKPYRGWKYTHPEFDAGILYVPGQGYNSKIMARRTFLGGVFGQVTKPYGRINALTAGAELYYDKIEPSSLTTIKRAPVQAGLQIGHVFLFNKVTFSQQLGFQLVKAGATAQDFYYRYGLTYKVSRHLIAGINLKTHSDNAEFADFRFAYRF